MQVSTTRKTCILWQIKCPLLTSDRIEAAHAEAHTTVTTGSYGSIVLFARRVVAGSWGLALGEIRPRYRGDQVSQDWDLLFLVAFHVGRIESDA